MLGSKEKSINLISETKKYLLKKLKVKQNNSTLMIYPYSNIVLN